MKNLTFNSIILTVIILVSFTTSSFGSRKDSLEYLEIKGNILEQQDDLSKIYKIELFSNNILVDSSVVVDNESFLLRVKKNSFYSVRIVKQGFLPMVLSIDTRNPYSNKFNFDEGYFVFLYGFNLSLSLQNQSDIDQTLVKK